MGCIDYDKISAKKETSEKVKFPCPQIDDLVQLQEEIGKEIRLAFIAADIDIIFSGSVVLNLLGLIDDEVSDIDIILSTHCHQTHEFDALAEVLVQALSGLPAFDKRQFDTQGSGFEMQCAFEWKGKKVEVFIEDNRRYVRLGSSSSGFFMGDDTINVSMVSDMFVKKWEYDPIKTSKHLQDIETYLTVNEQK